MAEMEPREEIGKQYKKKYLWLGISEVVLGVISLGVGIGLLVYTYYVRPHFVIALIPLRVFANTGPGLWSGILLIASGALGIASAAMPEFCPIVGAMVTTIVTAVASGLLTAWAPVGILTGATGFALSLTALGISGIVIPTVHSGYCCAAVCGNRRKDVDSPELEVK